MTKLENEEVLWESKNKQLLLTSHRLREFHKSVGGNRIKSIMLENVTSCELRTIREYLFIRRAALYFLLINGAVYLINHYFNQAELVKVFFGEVYIGPETARTIFFISIFIVIAYIVLFLLSVRSVFSFYSPGMVINFQLRWIDFDDVEIFISKVEAAKDKRVRQLFRVGGNG